jgi:hypothetical protein
MATKTLIAKTGLEFITGIAEDGKMIVSGEERWKKTETGIVLAERSKKFSDGQTVREIFLEIKAPSDTFVGDYCRFVFPHSFLGKLADRDLRGKTVWIRRNFLRWEHCNRSYRIENGRPRIIAIGKTNKGR